MAERITGRTALLVIDVQVALSRGPQAVLDAPAVIGRINRVIAAARAAGATIVFVQHETPGASFAVDSPGWALDPALHVRADDLRLRKTATDSFHRTELQAWLQARGIDHLVICGFQSDFCVDTTTRRALALGYPVTLVADGHATVDNGVLAAAQITAHHNRTLADIESFGPRATLVTAAQFAAD